MYVLNTSQKVEFERLKLHRSGPSEFVTCPLATGEVLGILDSEPERSTDVIDDDVLKPSYRTEQQLSKHRMFLCLCANVIEWILDCTLNSDLEVSTCISSRQTIPPLELMTNYFTCRG